MIKTAAGILPNTKFIMVMTLTRPGCKGKTENFDMVYQSYGEAIESLGLANVLLRKVRPLGCCWQSVMTIKRLSRQGDPL